MAEEPQALNLSWAFGLSHDVSSNIVNLSDGYHEKFCYVASHTAVLYDKRTKKQTFLQGHCNSISCLVGTEDRAMIVTADKGPDSLLVFWHGKSGNPIVSIPSPHPHGICALDISPDSQLLATVSAPDPETQEQEIALWDVGALKGVDGEHKPIVSSSIPAGDVQIAVRFNMNNTAEIISNGKRRVYFWGSSYPASNRFKYYSPPLRAKDFKQSVGDFVMSVFIPGTTQAVTATTDGDLVIWEEQGITAQVGTRATDRRAIKLMRIHNTPITFLSTYGDYLVSGGEEGFVRFYDPLLRIVAWFEDIGAGPILGVSFSTYLPDKSAQPDQSDMLNRFVVPQFVVATRQSQVVQMFPSSFDDVHGDLRRGSLLIEGLLPDIADMAANPTRPEFAVISHSGVVQRWDLGQHQLLFSKTFEGMTGTQILYSRDGSAMVIGFGNGSIHIRRAEDMAEIHVMRNTKASIIKLAMTSNGANVVAADATQTVLMYAFLPYKHNTMRWEFLGKNKAHHGPIVGLVFGESPAGQTRVFSLDSEGRIVEYDLETSSVQAGLRTKSYYDLPSASTPTSLCFAPGLTYFQHHSTDTLLLIADDAYKIRIYNPDTQATIATVLGPTYGGPVGKMTTFRAQGTTQVFVAYSTGERVVGLTSWPSDGDPNQTMGLIAHPTSITSISVSYDGRKLITAGGDSVVNVWDISTGGLEAVAKAALTSSDRWTSVIANDQLVSDLKDYFYYAQISTQGEETAQEREMTGRVPVDMVPALMRAAGFYPSESEIGAIMAHIKFMSAMGDSNHDSSTVGFQQLLQLYANHRPLFLPQQEDIKAAFVTLGANGSSGYISTSALAQALTTMGEALSEEELADALTILTGKNDIHEILPPQVDATTFSRDVLGFEA